MVNLFSLDKFSFFENAVFFFLKIVASAPNFPHGVIDPIEEISKVF